MNALERLAARDKADGADAAATYAAAVWASTKPDADSDVVDVLDGARRALGLSLDAVRSDTAHIHEYVPLRARVGDLEASLAAMRPASVVKLEDDALTWLLKRMEVAVQNRRAELLHERELRPTTETLLFALKCDLDRIRSKAPRVLAPEAIAAAGEFVPNG
jgi:hypothetical protein